MDAPQQCKSEKGESTGKKRTDDLALLFLQATLRFVSRRRF